MILKINKNNNDFYNIMGRYFADRSFIKELDCQLYDENCEWYLYQESDSIKGFASIQNKNNYFYLDNFYVFEEYRNEGIGQKIVNEIIKEYENIKLISRNEAAIHIFKKVGFVECGENGRYKKLQRKCFK